MHGLVLITQPLDLSQMSYHKKAFVWDFSQTHHQYQRALLGIMLLKFETFYHREGELGVSSLAS